LPLHVSSIFKEETINLMGVKKYGWKPQLPDFRDKVFSIEHLAPIQSVYLATKYKLPAVYDQLSLGDCTGNGIAACVHFDLLNKHDQKIINPWIPSRLFIYYNERLIEGTVDQDAGAEIRDGIKTLVTYGVCSEDAWLYNINQFTAKPSSYAYNLAKAVKAVTYQSVDNTNKQLLVNTLLQGYPIVFGFTVYQSFESDIVAQTGVVPMPSATESVIGGHCCVLVGYNSETDRFVARNSWGKTFGMGGYFSIPADYITNPNLASDFWVIETVV
jgi:C1A family cysteine protease